uniref:SLAM family member 9-like n=1 Tax=Gopherus evgoodei TaxID=1825980 RepID=A0A8C4YFI5_9SAUR
MAGAPQAFLLFLLLLSQPRGKLRGALSTPAGESVVLPLDSGMMFKSTTVPLAVVTPGGLGGLPRLVVEDERYRGRVRLYGRTYSLEISNLTMTDEGKYEAEKNLIGHNKYSCGYPLSIYSECLRVCIAGERARHLTYTWTRPAGGAVLSTEESLLVQHRLGDEDSPITCTATNPVSNSSSWSSWHLVRILVSRWCPTPPQTPALSYCHAKGILVLGVLGTLLAGILTVHVLAAREQTRP